LERFKALAPALRQLALLLVDLREYQQAFEVATKAREAYPNDPAVAKALGIVMYQRNELNRAVPLLRQATANLVSDPDAFFHLGMAHYKLNQMGESSMALQKALELDPNASFAAEARKVLMEIDTIRPVQ
jgi:tetratricopeptide (TPR) repeat protein